MARDVRVAPLDGVEAQLPVAQLARGDDGAAPVVSCLYPVASDTARSADAALDDGFPPMGIVVTSLPDSESEEPMDFVRRRPHTSPPHKRGPREIFFDEPLTRPIARWFDEDSDCVCCATVSSGVWTAVCHGLWVVLKAVAVACAIAWLASQQANGVQARTTVVTFLLFAAALLAWCGWCVCICAWNIAYVAPSCCARCMNYGYKRHSDGGSICAALMCLLCIGLVVLGCSIAVE